MFRRYWKLWMILLLALALDVWPRVAGHAMNLDEICLAEVQVTSR